MCGWKDKLGWGYYYLVQSIQPFQVALLGHLFNILFRVLSNLLILWHFSVLNCTHFLSKAFLQGRVACIFHYKTKSLTVVTSLTHTNCNVFSDSEKTTTLLTECAGREQQLNVFFPWLKPKWFVFSHKVESIEALHYNTEWCGLEDGSGTDSSQPLAQLRGSVDQASLIYTLKSINWKWKLPLQKIWLL